MKWCCFRPPLCISFRLNWVKREQGDNAMIHAPEWIRTCKPVIRSPSSYLWTTEPTSSAVGWISFTPPPPLSLSLSLSLYVCFHFHFHLHPNFENNSHIKYSGGSRSWWKGEHDLFEAQSAEQGVTGRGCPPVTPSPGRKKIKIRWKCLDDFWSTPKSIFCNAILYINIDTF